MRRNRPGVSIGGPLIALLAVCNAILLEQAATTSPKSIRLIYITLPLLIIVIILFRKRKI